MNRITTDGMKMAFVRFICTAIITLIVLQTSGIVCTQTKYVDHRNHHIGSLEQLIRTNPPQGKELISAYSGLMFGYREFDINKSAAHTYL